MTRIAVFVIALIAMVTIAWAIGSHLFSGAEIRRPAPAVEVRKQFADTDENETATTLLTIVAKADESVMRRGRDELIDYLRREIASPAVETAAPPPDVNEFLTKQASVIQSVRLLLAKNPPPVWKQRASEILDVPMPDLGLHLTLFSALAADALASRSRHNDAAAWSDLHAIWVLSRALWQRPEMDSSFIALTGSRMVAAVAARMPAPPPPWWSEFAAFDVRSSLVRALEYDAWRIRARAQKYPAGEPDDNSGPEDMLRTAAEPLLRPIEMMSAEDRARKLQEVAHAVAASDPCRDIPHDDMARWVSTVRRLHRFIIEREAAEKLFEIERSARPATIDTRSACRAAQWVYQRTDNGGFELKFNRKLPPIETRMQTPLVYKR